MSLVNSHVAEYRWRRQTILDSPVGTLACLQPVGVNERRVHSVYSIPCPIVALFTYVVQESTKCYCPPGAYRDPLG